MESTAVNVKEEDTVAKGAVANIAATDAANSIAVADEIVPPVKLDKEIIMITENVEHVVVSEQADVSNETAITVNATSNKEDQLNKAMASTTISTNEVDEIKHNLGETVLDKQQKPATAMVEKDIVINETSDLDISLKTKSESDEIYNSTMGSVFEDAVEYITNDEEDNVVKEQPQDVFQEENDVDDESSSQHEVEGGDGEEDYDEEIKDPTAPAEPVVPVPVDDDTNDPQYIPRRGRFYEHDDRMAYSTTSSEGSESDNGYEEDSGDDDGVSDRRRVRRRHTGIKKQKSVTPVDTAENTALAVVDGSLPTKRVLAISKVAAATKDSETAVTADGLAKKLGVGSRKSRDLDALDRWTHDMYDENEQTRKSRDELLASYGYDIREESEAPRARRHHKYGRAATTKYTRSWQDTKAYIGATGGQQNMKVKRGGMARRNVGGLNKNINKSTTDEYTSEFPALDDTNKSEPNTSTLSPTESPAVVEISDQNHEQQLKTLSVQNEDKKSVAAVVETSQARHHTPSSRATPKYNTTSPTNRNNRQDQQNGGPSPSSSSTNNKNYFNRSSTESPISKEKGAQVNRDSPSSASNSNFYNRRPQQNSGGHNQHHNYKQQHYNNSQHNQQHQNSSPSGPRSRNFHQHHTSQQYNRDRYFSKGSTPSSTSSQHNYDQQHQSGAPTTAGTGRTQHGGGHYQNYNNRQYENENQPIDPPAPPTPVVRSSKRYSVQSRRELPDPVLNFGGISKAPQPQPPVPQQQNGLVMQDQQMQPTPQQLQQQQPIQIHQQPPPLLPQYHQPLQQIHHGMVLDHNTGMMVMAAADPTMYHHQMYATPQYATGVAPGPAAGSADDQNAAAAAAAAALQMLAAQAAVYQPVPTGATGVTSPPSGTQSLQQPETFMTTYYQPQQQPQQQPPPRRVNLAIPIVAPPPEPNQQQGNLKTNLSTTPPPTAASTN